MNDKEKLLKLRNSLEVVTQDILELLSKRFELGKEIATIKNRLDLPLVDPTQERKLYKSIQNQSDILQINKNFSKTLLKLIIEETISREKDHLKKFNTKTKTKKNIGIIKAR